MLCESCAQNPWVPLDGTPVYGVRPEDIRSLPEAPAQYDSPVQSSVSISQTTVQEPRVVPAEQPYAPEPSQDIYQEPAEPTSDQSSYFISPPAPVPTSVYPEEPASEQSIFLSQPDVPTYNVQADPILATVSPIAETNTYSSVQEPVAPVQIPLGIQEEIQQQQQSILSNFDSPTPAVDDAPQQVAVFFSAPNQQQPIAAPTLEYLPPYAA